MDETFSDWPWRDAIFAAPALGSVFAVSYDVGSFFGIGIGFFSIFSLSEHIVFALEALPFAVMGALYVVLMPIYFRTADNLKPKLFANVSIGIAISIISFVILAVAAFLVYKTKAYHLLIGVASIVLCLNFIRRIKVWHKQRIAFWGIMLSFAGILFAGGFGFDNSKLFMSSPENPYTINGGQLQGKIYMAGDRGILFFDSSTEKMVFMKWEGIRSIERTETVRK